MQIENTSITISADKLNEIINVAVEEIAKHVDICNENGRLVMKVKDGENITIQGNDCYIPSEKDFCDPLVGIHIKSILIMKDPDSGAIKQCTIPTGMSVTSNADDHCGINLQFGQPHPLIHCNGFFGSVPNVTTDGFCRLVQEKINDMQTGANVNQNNNTNTISTNTDNSMDDKTIDEVLEYINGNVRSDVQSGHGDNKNQGKKKKKKKTNKKNKKGNKAKQTGEQNANQVEDQKEDQKVVGKQEEPKFVDKTEDQEEEPKVEEIQTSTNIKANENLISTNEENYINTTGEQTIQIIEEQPHQIEQQQNIGGQPQIEQPLNNDVPQHAGAQNGPNYIARPFYGDIGHEYDHYLQEANIYYTKKIHKGGRMTQLTPKKYLGEGSDDDVRRLSKIVDNSRNYIRTSKNTQQTPLSLDNGPFFPKGMKRE